MTDDTLTDPDRQGLDPAEVWTTDYVRTELWGNVYDDALSPGEPPSPEDIEFGTDRLLAWLSATCETVLDVGCGWVPYAVPPSVSLTGADISPAMLDLARDLHPDHTFVHASAFDLPFDDAEFDGLRSSGMLRHIEEWDAALNEMVRVTSDRMAFTHLTADTPEKCGPYQWCTTREAVIDVLPPGAVVDVETQQAKDGWDFESTRFMVQL